MMMYGTNEKSTSEKSTLTEVRGLENVDRIFGISGILRAGWKLPAGLDRTKV